jgi:hypothetical protein
MKEPAAIRKRERWHHRHKIDMAAGKGCSRVWAGSKPARPLGRRMNVSGRRRTPAEMAAFVKEEIYRWGEVIRKNNIVAE